MATVFQPPPPVKAATLPDGIQSDPQAIVQHLVSSGQVSQAQINRAYQQAQQMGFKS